MALVGISWFFVFKYIPMIGIVISFQDYRPWTGILGSEWVGFEHFIRFFNSYYFFRLLRNTLIISLGKILFGMPIPIIFALLLNEVRNKTFKKVVQTVTYFPHFLSWVVVGGLAIALLSPSDGPVNAIRAALGLESIYYMIEPEYFRPLLIGTSVWKGFGWNSILYLAAITTIDPQLYEAAEIDGASRLQRVFRITLPHLVPIAVLLLTLSLGRILNEDFNQILMFMGNNAQLYEVGDVLETYVYREGLLNANYSFAAAVGLFKGFVGLGLVMTFNWVARKLGQTALW